MSQGSSQRIQTSCPGCGKAYTVSADFVGRQVKCQACQHSFLVESTSAQASPPSNTPPQTAAPQPAPQKVQTACPGCGKGYSVSADFVGKQVKCQACEHTFQVAIQQPASPLHQQQPAQQATGGNCAICQSPIIQGEPSMKCPGCSGAFHTDCWEYNKGCGIYGCSEAPPTEGLNSLEIPASHWGQENKECPNCTRVILAAAVRCKHCGATFECANPQDQGSFQEHESNKAKLPLIKIGAIVLLVFSLLPCTAPIAAIAGPIWYVMNRKSISMLPGFHSALCKIAVGVSICITAMLIGVTVLNLMS